MAGEGTTQGGEGDTTPREGEREISREAGQVRPRTVMYCCAVMFLYVLLIPIYFSESLRCKFTDK